MTAFQEDDLVQTVASLATEARDPALADVDLLPILERCRLQNLYDQSVAQVVAEELPAVAAAVERIVKAIRSGGRLIYVGAGTSGRLGVLDAAECPPTFGTDPTIIQAVIAGGPPALIQAVEGIEDDASAGAAAITNLQVSASDCVVGIAASGRTPYVIGALDAANIVGAMTIAVTNNRPSELESVASLTIAAVVGPEFVAGSTRLKAGTAQKLILNMLTTQSMIELGKTYGNVMVDVMATNRKLKIRAQRMVKEVTGATESEVFETLNQASGSAKLAILMLIADVNASTGMQILEDSQGKLRVALESTGRKQK